MRKYLAGSAKSTIMRYKLAYLPSFNRDIILAEANFIDFPNKAAALFGSLDKKLRNLADMPNMYPVFEQYPNYRKMVLLDYIVLYAVVEEEKSIYLHRLLPGKTDINRQLI